MMRRVPLAAAALLLAAAAAQAAEPAAAPDAKVALKITGPEEAVFLWRRDACEPDDIPDIPARAFRDERGTVHLVSSYWMNRSATGPSLDRLERSCAVVMASRKDADPAAFGDREWLHAFHTADGRTVHALIHNEYRGHEHPGRCPAGEYRKCWLNTVTYAVSTDGGRRFVAPPAPQDFVAGIPYAYRFDAGQPVGIFNPSNIVASGGYYYTLVMAGEYRAQKRGTCVLRTADLSNPSSWRAWNGSDFSVRFVDPYREKVADPAAHVCAPVARERIGEMRDSVVFSTWLNRFVLVGPAFEPGTQGEDRRWGIHVALSRDLVTWSMRRMVLEAEFPWTFRCGDRKPIAYASLLDPQSPSRSFESMGRTAWLYFTRFNPENCQLRKDRDLIRVPVRIEIDS